MDSFLSSTWRLFGLLFFEGWVLNPFGSVRNIAWMLKVCGNHHESQTGLGSDGLKYSWISFWFSPRKLGKLMGLRRLNQSPLLRPSTPKLIFWTRLEPSAAGPSSKPRVGDSWASAESSNGASEGRMLVRYQAHLHLHLHTLSQLRLITFLNQKRLRLFLRDAYIDHMYFRQETMTSVHGHFKM